MFVPSVFCFVTAEGVLSVWVFAAHGVPSFFLLRSRCFGRLFPLLLPGKKRAFLPLFLRVQLLFAPRRDKLLSRLTFQQMILSPLLEHKRYTENSSTGAQVFFTSTGAEMFCSLQEVPEGYLALSNCWQTSLVAWLSMRISSSFCKTKIK